MNATKILNFISDNYGTLTTIGLSIWGLVKTNVFPLIKEFISARNALVKDETTRKFIEKAEEKVKTLLVESMSAIEKTTKEEIVSKIANGELTKDSLYTLPSTVISKVKNQLSDKYKDALKDEYGDVEDYLATKAQYLYDKYKKDDTSVIGTVKVSDIVTGITTVVGTEDITSKTTELLDKLKEVADNSDNIDTSVIEEATTDTTEETKVEDVVAEPIVAPVEENSIVINDAVAQAEVINSDVNTVDASTLNIPM